MKRHVNGHHPGVQHDLKLHLCTRDRDPIADDVGRPDNE